MLKNKEETIFTVANGIFMGTLVMAGIVASKLVKIGPFEFDAGLLVYAVTFIITDIVTETMGKKYAIRLAKAGLIAILAAYVMTQFALLLPHADSWDIEKEYEIILQMGGRTFLAFLISYTISQAVDLTVFSWIKNKTGNRHLWLRNNISTFFGGGLDAIVFSTIAFYGIYPLGSIILAAFTIRIMVALLDTPIVYLAVWMLGKKH